MSSLEIWLNASTPHHLTVQCSALTGFPVSTLPCHILQQPRWALVWSWHPCLKPSDAFPSIWEHPTILRAAFLFPSVFTQLCLFMETLTYSFTLSFEGKKGRVIFCPLVHSLKCLSQFRDGPGAGNLIWVSLVRGKDPSSWAIICRLLGCTSAGSRKQELSQDLKPCTHGMRRGCHKGCHNYCTKHLPRHITLLPECSCSQFSFSHNICYHVTNWMFCLFILLFSMYFLPLRT